MLCCTDLISGLKITILKCVYVSIPVKYLNNNVSISNITLWSLKYIDLLYGAYLVNDE